MRLLLALALAGSVAYLAGCRSNPYFVAGLTQGLADGMAQQQVVNAYAQRQAIEAQYFQQRAKAEAEYLAIERERLELERRATEVQKAREVRAVKRYAELRHVKGPYVTIPPQILSAEYVDTGEGHGPVRILSAGNILDGEYRTIGAGQSFRGVVTARLLDPDKVFNFPRGSLRGFASFMGNDGTVLECAYAVTGPNGNGLGSCLDNRGNQYQLSF